MGNPIINDTTQNSASLKITDSESISYQQLILYSFVNFILRIISNSLISSTGIL